MNIVIVMTLNQAELYFYSTILNTFIYNTYMHIYSFINRIYIFCKTLPSNIIIFLNIDKTVPILYRLKYNIVKYYMLNLKKKQVQLLWVL